MNRRHYSQLNDVEKALVRFALPKDEVTRNEVLEALSEEYTKTSLKQAFSELCEERRLYRVGNRSEHIMIRRDLF